MTETYSLARRYRAIGRVRFTAFLFGGVAYLTFLFTILYAIRLRVGPTCRRAIDTGAEIGDIRGHCRQSRADVVICRST